MSKKNHKDSVYEKQCKEVRKRASRRSGLYTFALCTVILASLVACYALVLKPTQQYESANIAMEKGDWQSAADSFKKIESFRDSKKLYLYASCMSLFDGGRLSDASAAYLSLDDELKAKVNAALGSFSSLAENAISDGDYESAYLYYSLDTENPERDDAMYAITVYLDSKNLIDEHKSGEARSQLVACLDVSHALGAQLQDLINESYKSEFDYYDSFTFTNLTFAVEGMEAICDEYEPAHVYLRDLGSAYYGGIISMREGKYGDAINQFSDISDYSDSADKIDECRVLLANEQAKTGQTDAALNTVSEVSDWQKYISILPEDEELTALILANSPKAAQYDEANA